MLVKRINKFYSLEMDTNEETKSTKVKAQNVNVNLKCRFYENEFPEVDELVMVKLFLHLLTLRSKSEISSKTEPMLSSLSTTIKKVSLRV